MIPCRLVIATKNFIFIVFHRSKSFHFRVMRLFHQTSIIYKFSDKKPNLTIMKSSCLVIFLRNCSNVWRTIKKYIKVSTGEHNMGSTAPRKSELKSLIGRISLYHHLSHVHHQPNPHGQNKGFLIKVFYIPFASKFKCHKQLPLTFPLEVFQGGLSLCELCNCASSLLTIPA